MLEELVVAIFEAPVRTIEGLGIKARAFTAHTRSSGDKPWTWVGAKYGNHFASEVQAVAQAQAANRLA